MDTTTQRGTKRKPINIEVVYNDSEDNMGNWRNALQMLAILDQRQEHDMVALAESTVAK
jgi:hypothetical protein